MFQLDLEVPISMVVILRDKQMGFITPEKMPDFLGRGWHRRGAPQRFQWLSETLFNCQGSWEPHFSITLLFWNWEVADIRVTYHVKPSPEIKSWNGKPMLHKKGVRNTKEPHKTQDLSLQKARQNGTQKNASKKTPLHISIFQYFSLQGTQWGKRFRWNELRNFNEEWNFDVTLPETNS